MKLLPMPVVTGLGHAPGASAPFDLRSRLCDRKALKVMDARSRLALEAACIACDQARPITNPERLGISLAVADTDFAKADVASALAANPELPPAARLQKNLHPLWLLRILPNMPASHLAIQFQAHGPCHTCHDPAQALEHATALIRSGETDGMLCGFTGLEEAVVFFVEPESFARQRGTPIQATLSGHTLTPALPAWNALLKQETTHDCAR